MKSKYLLTIGYIFSILNSNLSAQSIEESVNGDTYILNSLTNMIENKKNKLAAYNECEYFRIDNVSTVDNEFWKAFSKTRIQELKSKNTKLTLTLFCDSSGYVKELSFHISNGVKTLSLTEIQLLENQLKKLKLKINNPCANTKYYVVTKIYRFEDY